MATVDGNRGAGVQSGAVTRCDRRLVREHAVFEAEDIERAGILRLAFPALLPHVTRIAL